MRAGFNSRQRERVIRSALFGLALWLGLLSMGALAQSDVTLLPPSSRFAAPGDFVTLVFRVEAEEGLSVQAEARASPDWQILRQPGVVTVEPGQSRPIAVTLAVPADAPAFTEAAVTLELATVPPLDAQTTLTVSERLSLALEAPETVVLGPEGFSVTLANQGNVTSRVRLELRQRNEIVVARERDLEPQERAQEKLVVMREGSYTLLLTGDGEEVRKRLSVTRFGVPELPPFALAAVASTHIGVDGWQGELSLDGALSDFMTLSARLDLKDVESSYATLTHEAWTAQLGGASDPYRLGLTTGVGASGHYRAPRWSVAGALGKIGPDVSSPVSGYVAGAYRDRTTFFAGGLGLRTSGAQFSVRGDVDLGALGVAFEARYSGALDASLEADQVLPGGTLKGQVKVANLSADEAALTARLDYRGGGRHLYASGTLPLSEKSVSRSREAVDTQQWSVGLQDRLTFADLPLPSLTLGLELGNSQGFAQLRHDVSLAREWVGESRFGVVYGEAGVGLDAATRWSQNSENYYSFGSDLTYYPGSAKLDGQVDLKLQTTYAPFTLFGNSTWDITQGQLGFNIGTVWYRGPWRVNLAGHASYGYRADEAFQDPFAWGVSLAGDYTFDIPVPRQVSGLAGGRRVGVVQGAVRSDTGPLAGAEVRVGRFRLLTDEAGRYRAEVAPGTYKVSLETARLPITYRLIGDDTASIEVALREEVTQDFQLARTAAISGRVLEDADADGVADAPTRGLAARFLLVDPEGLYRSLITDEQGNFSARGLLPGEATLQLVDYPLGSVVVGEATRKLAIRAGEVSDVTFLLQPARTRARSFGGGALRVRRVTPSAGRVPPGSAPLVRATIQGDAERVSVRTAAGSYELTLNGDAWLGRVGIPRDTPPGIFSFEVIAENGDNAATRRGQLIIDPSVPLLEVTADGPVQAGATLDVSASPLFAATEVGVQGPLGEVRLVEVEPKRFAAQLLIAADTKDAVYELLFRAVAEDGTVVEQTRRVRVLNTQ